MAEPTYTVQAGDGGWYQIARKLTPERGYPIDWRELMRLNPQYVRPGGLLYGNGTEVLTVPPRPETAPAGTPGTAKLKEDLRNMANGSDFSFGRNYDRVRNRINAASAQEKQQVLADQPLLTLLRLKMDINDFAMAVELLGRQAPTGKELSENSIVKSACDTAWAASNSDAKDPNDWRENGGYIFMNLVSGEISISTVPPGNWGQLNLPNPDLKIVPADSIVVGIFHTHPNPNAPQVCEDHDNDKSKVDGVPDVVRGPKGPFPCGVERRLHLAGARSYPGPSGGDPPK